MHQSDRHILLEAKRNVRRARATRKTCLRFAELAFGLVGLPCAAVTVVNGWGLGVLIVLGCVGGIATCREAVLALNEVSDDQIDRSLVQMVRNGASDAADAHRVLMSRMERVVDEQVSRAARDRMLSYERIREEAEKAARSAIDTFDDGKGMSFSAYTSEMVCAAVMQETDRERALITHGPWGRLVMGRAAV